MRVLFIGGTGNISTSVSRMAAARGIELYLLTRGQANAALRSLERTRSWETSSSRSKCGTC
ncbi:MAG: hypothetical protein MUF84_06585 [Anaerolineae bacterium]|nr:hypothetical protein [Anaerolineae bacterium]